MRKLSLGALAVSAFALAACATGGMTSFVNPDTGEIVPTATLVRGDDGVIRDAHGNVVREAQFVRATSEIADEGNPSDMFCTRERVVGTHFSETVCFTRREAVTARDQARDALDNSRNAGDPAPIQGIGG